MRAPIDEASWRFQTSLLKEAKRRRMGRNASDIPNKEEVIGCEIEEAIVEFGTHVVVCYRDMCMAMDDTIP